VRRMAATSSTRRRRPRPWNRWWPGCHPPNFRQRRQQHGPLPRRPAGDFRATPGTESGAVAGAALPLAFRFGPAASIGGGGRIPWTSGISFWRALKPLMAVVFGCGGKVSTLSINAAAANRSSAWLLRRPAGNRMRRFRRCDPGRQPRGRGCRCCRPTAAHRSRRRAGCAGVASTRQAEVEVVGRRASRLPLSRTAKGAAWRRPGRAAASAPAALAVGHRRSCHAANDQGTGQVPPRGPLPGRRHAVGGQVQGGSIPRAPIPLGRRFVALGWRSMQLAAAGGSAEAWARHSERRCPAGTAQRSRPGAEAPRCRCWRHSR